MTDSGGPVAEDQTQHEFYWSSEAEPHSQRRREILSKYGPQVRALYGYDNRTAVQVRPTSRPDTALHNAHASRLPPPSAWQRDVWRRPVGLRYTWGQFGGSAAFSLSAKLRMACNGCRPSAAATMCSSTTIPDVLRHWLLNCSVNTLWRRWARLAALPSRNRLSWL
jgi:hypothetical protein